MFNEFKIESRTGNVICLEVLLGNLVHALRSGLGAHATTLKLAKRGGAPFLSISTQVRATPRRHALGRRRGMEAGAAAGGGVLSAGYRRRRSRCRPRPPRLRLRLRAPPVCARTQLLCGNEAALSTWRRPCERSR